jgi:two-component system, NtrC family, sensor kinase
LILRGSLFRKYAVYFVAVVSAALIASALVQLYFTYQENKDGLLNLQREKAAAAATRIETYVQEIERQLDWMRLPQVGPQTPEQRRIEYLKLLRVAPAITDVMLLDAAGREQLRVSRLSMDVSGGDSDHSKDATFIQARSGKTYLGPVYFRKETEPYMTIAVASMGNDANVTVAEVNLKFIWDVISRIRIGKGGLAYVVDSRGRLVAHPDISFVLQKRDLSHLPQVAAAIHGGGQDTPAVSIAPGPQGSKVLTAHAPIASLGWHVLVEQPLSEAFAPLYAALQRTGLLLLAGLIAAFLVSLYVARRMVKPIQIIQGGAAQLATGKLDQRIEVNTGDELQALAGQFNDMAAQLRESYADLERRVEERTRELSDSQKQLQVANRHKSEFLAGMSHELRTPLNAIIGFSEVLSEQMFGDVNAKQAQYLRNIHSSGTHLLSLINDVLDLSKIEAGKMELELSRFDLRAALESSIVLIRERAMKNNVQLALECADGIGEWIADERKFKQIMLNLLSNAVKFTPQGGRVTVCAAHHEEQVEIAVSDTGIGIKPEDQDLVFQEFRQASGSYLKKTEGTGLGLALTRRFVELHGGKLTLHSEVGKGSTFVFTLPQKELQPVSPELQS